MLSRSASLVFSKLIDFLILLGMEEEEQDTPDVGDLSAHVDDEDKHVSHA